MKALSMPVSSPSRAEKFPPPLTRFLKGNVGSRSRGRSRASPMFSTRSKKNASGVNIETTQEPSSPKVTCIGQVRVRRSAKSKPKSSARTGQVTSNRRPCWWLKKPLSCSRIFPRFCSQRTFCGPFLRWALFFRSGYCNKVDAREDSFRVNSNQKCQTNENCVAGGNNSNSSSNSDIEVDGGIKYENLETLVPRKKKDLIFSPPKNALILTRCRSAPYRSSSLAARIWGSPPLESSETQGVKTENEAKPVQESQESQNPTSQNVIEESRTTPEISKELGKTEKNVEELQGIAGGAIHPLQLTRSKSEPARTGERLNPECNLSSPTRLADVEQCSQHNS